MSDDPFSLDSLLEDLDAAVHSPPAAAQSTHTTMKFVPHPPARDKQTSHVQLRNFYYSSVQFNDSSSYHIGFFLSQTTTYNPKNRFAVQPSSSSSTSPEAANDPHSARSAQRFAYGSPEKAISAHASSSSSSANQSQNKPFRSDPDENSIDNLLNLISSPSASAQKPAASSGAFTYSQPSSSGLNSQFFLDSQKVGSNAGAGHSGRFPTMNTDNNNSSAYNNTTSSSTNHSSVYVPHTIAADSNLSSPFDSPGSTNSAHKTHNAAHTTTLHTHHTPTSHANTTHNTHGIHSTSMYNMSTNTNNTTSVFTPNLASSFDSAESNSDRVPTLFNTNTSTSTYNNSNTVMYSASSSGGNGSSGNSSVSTHLQPIHTGISGDNTQYKGRSGTGVSGGLFGSSTDTTNTTAYNPTSYANAVSPKGNTATFTSQNSSLRAQNEPKQSQSAHFLPTSINATTVVSNSSVGSGNSGASSSSGAAKQKCSRVVIGGSSIPRGRKTSAFANFACNNLRCLQCNFKVHCFSGSEWDASVDYMFLRNTVPNEAKLATKLTRSAEKCAYCCQCSSASEGSERELNATLSAQGPQWVCAGH